jgi:hypothetical protein
MITQLQNAPRECCAVTLTGDRSGDAYHVAIPASCFGGELPTHRAVVASGGDPVVILVSPTVADGINKGHWLLSDARLLAAAALVAELREQYVWDVDVAIAAGCAANSDAITQWRTRCEVTWVRQPWPAKWKPYADVEQKIQPARARMSRMRFGHSDGPARQGSALRKTASSGVSDRQERSTEQPRSRVWRLGTTSNAYWEGGEDQGEDIWNRLRAGGFAALGWEAVDNPFPLFERHRGDSRALHLALRAKAEEAGLPRPKAAHVASVYRLYHEIKPGDLIVAARGGRFLAIGVVSDPAEGRPNKFFDRQLCRGFPLIVRLVQDQWEYVDPDSGWPAPDVPTRRSDGLPRPEGLRRTLAELTHPRTIADIRRRLQLSR